MLKKFMVILLTVALAFGLSKVIYAKKLTEEDIKSLPEAKLELKREELHENRITLMKTTELNGPRTLAEEVDFLGEFLDKMLKTANAIVVFDKADTAWAGLEFSFYQGEGWDIIWGFVPDEEGQLYSYGGIEVKDIPLIGQLGDIFKRLDIAFLYCSDKKVRVGLSYQWRSETKK